MFKVILFTLLASNAFAESEIGFGSYSYHIFNNPDLSQRYSNKVNASGSLIQNNMYSFKITKPDSEFYTSDAFFIGENSVGTLMSGYMGASGVYLNKYTQFGAIYGAYAQDNTEFMRRGIYNCMAWFPESKISVIPIFGVEVNFKVNLSDKVFIKLNNVITPVVTNHTISIGFEF